MRTLFVVRAIDEHVSTKFDDARGLTSALDP